MSKIKSPMGDESRGRLCPECGDNLHPRAISCACGWRSKPRPKLSQSTFDQSCCWNDHGYVCGKPGVISHTTTGQGDWYCRKHYAALTHSPMPVDGAGSSYRADWFRSRNLPYQDAPLGNVGAFQCIGYPTKGAAQKEAA